VGDFEVEIAPAVSGELKCVIIDVIGNEVFSEQ